MQITFISVSPLPNLQKIIFTLRPSNIIKPSISHLQYQISRTNRGLLTLTSHMVYKTARIIFCLKQPLSSADLSTSSSSLQWNTYFINLDFASSSQETISLQFNLLISEQFSQFLQTFIDGFKNNFVDPFPTTYSFSFPSFTSVLHAEPISIFQVFSRDNFTSHPLRLPPLFIIMMLKSLSNITYEFV